MKNEPLKYAKKQRVSDMLFKRIHGLCQLGDSQGFFGSSGTILDYNISRKSYSAAHSTVLRDSNWLSGAENSLALFENCRGSFYCIFAMTVVTALAFLRVLRDAGLGAAQDNSFLSLWFVANKGYYVFEKQEVASAMLMMLQLTIRR